MSAWRIYQRPNDRLHFVPPTAKPRFCTPELDAYALRWRWTHLGLKAVKALPFYLFPAYLRPWTWRGIVLAVVIILGYGQITYLLLDLLFLFPVREKGGIPSFVSFKHTTTG